MKNAKLLINLLIFIGLITAFLSCEDVKNEVKGTVTFGANYHVINCISTVTIFIDDKEIGTLQDAVNDITDCYAEGNITKEIPIGEHSYKVEIRSTAGCNKEITGTLTITENECTKVFIDYREIFSNDIGENIDLIINETEYLKALKDPSLSIIDMSISENTLKIKFTASGCTGKTWIAKLIASENVIETNPCQRPIILTLVNNESCTAMPIKEVSFNIETLQIKGDNKVKLNILDKSILYEY